MEAHLRDKDMDRLKDRGGGELQSIALTWGHWPALGLSTQFRINTASALQMNTFFI